MSKAESRDVVVLGAGIQGVCCALALAHRGHRVTVVEAADGCMLRASLRNEGKIHLGLVYANDPTGRTPGLMLDAALRFGDLIERWVGRALPWDAMRSRPFTYAVLEDSLLPPEDLFDVYATLQSHFEARGPACYVGATPERLWQEIDLEASGDLFAPGSVVAAVQTAEVALDPELLRHELCGALHAHPMIERRFGHTVREAVETTHGFRVTGTRADGESWSLEAPMMVNCLWDGRIVLDAALGIVPPRPWVHRLKYRVLGRLPAGLAGLPSLTFVLGRFGDVVVHSGRPTYLSWYPSCLAGFDSSLTPPVDWADTCAGRDNSPETLELARATVSGLAEILPALADFTVDAVDAGVIVAWGTTDIDDPKSELHERHRIGIHAHDGWYSIDTGKLTTAPLFAEQLAALVGPPS